MAVNFDRIHYALSVASLILATAVVLLVMGREPWGAAAGPGLWTGEVDGRLTSQRLADPYAFTHIGHGLLFFGLLSLIASDYLEAGARLVVATGLEGLWEVAENTPFVIERYREATIALGYYGDSVLNSVGDMLAMVVGFLVAVRLPNDWVLPVFLVLEAVLVFWIRDSLLLNILMLVYPVPGIQEWQAAG
jgi:hypothetical protein